MAHELFLYSAPCLLQQWIHAPVSARSLSHLQQHVCVRWCHHLSLVRSCRRVNSCQPWDADICSRSRATRSSTALCLTSCLLYSFNDVTMQGDIMESCEESAPGYSANHGSTDCAQSSPGSVVVLSGPPSQALVMATGTFASTSCLKAD